MFAFCCGFFHLLISRCAAVALIILIVLPWGSPALCGEIHEAAKAGDVAKVQALLKANPHLVSSRNSAGLTPLHVAAFEGQKEVAELLIANQADVNAKTVYSHGAPTNQVHIPVGDGMALKGQYIDGLTPLHYAAMEGHKEIVELLLAHKADVNARDSMGATPLHNAAFWGQKEIVELLLANGSDVNAQDKNGHTPMAEAVNGGDREGIAELLRQHGGQYDFTPPTSPDKKNVGQRTVLSPEVAGVLILAKPAPVYPPLALAARVTGTVVLHITVSMTGEVVATKVVAGNPMLLQTALDSVKGWRFRPYMANGAAVGFETTVSIPFNLPQ